MRAYQVLPEVFVPVVGGALPFAEIALGVLLIVGLGLRAGGVVAGLLLTVFIIGISSAWIRGLRIDCGCFGGGGQLGHGVRPTYGLELTRDVGLFVLAAVCVVFPASIGSADRGLRTLIVGSDAHTDPDRKDGR